MFDVGFWELVLIFGMGLIILGPERMPRVASQVGRWIGRARRTASTLRRQLEQEIAAVDAPPPPPPRKPKPLKPVNRPPDETASESDDSDVDSNEDTPAAEEGENAASTETGDETAGEASETKEADQNSIGSASGK